MTDKKKQSISENPKPKYQPPKMILFGGTNEGSGDCGDGSSDSSSCLDGASATNTCWTGSGAAGKCQTGSSASDCGTGSIF